MKPTRATRARGAGILYRSVGLSVCLTVIHKGRMYWHIRLSFITFTSSSDTILLPVALSLPPSLPDARPASKPGPAWGRVVLVACILRDLCNRRRRRRRLRRRRFPNDIHTEDASGAARRGRG